MCIHICIYVSENNINLSALQVPSRAVDIWPGMFALDPYTLCRQKCGRNERSNHSWKHLQKGLEIAKKITRTRTVTLAYTHAHTYTHTGTHTRTHTHTHKHTHTHTHRRKGLGWGGVSSSPLACHLVMNCLSLSEILKSKNIEVLVFGG